MEELEVSGASLQHAVWGSGPGLLVPVCNFRWLDVVHAAPPRRWPWTPRTSVGEHDPGASDTRRSSPSNDDRKYAMHVVVDVEPNDEVAVEGRGRGRGRWPTTLVGKPEEDEAPSPDRRVRAGIRLDLALGQLMYDLRSDAGLSQRELAERMGTTQPVISRLRPLDPCCDRALRR